MKNIQKVIYIIIAILIIAGICVVSIKGYKKELDYSDRQIIVLTNNLGFDKTKVEEIAKNVLVNKEVKVLEVERFSNAVEIISTEINEQEKEDIINKVNEEYTLEIQKDDISIIDIKETKIKDMINPYIFSVILTFILIIVYFMIMYHKLGLKNIFAKSVFIPILFEIMYFSVIAIARVPLGKVVFAISMGIYVLSIGYLSFSFHNKKQKLFKLDKKEND